MEDWTQVERRRAGDKGEWKENVNSRADERGLPPTFSACKEDLAVEFLVGPVRRRDGCDEEEDEEERLVEAAEERSSPCGKSEVADTLCIVSIGAHCL